MCTFKYKEFLKHVERLSITCHGSITWEVSVKHFLLENKIDFFEQFPHS